MCKPSGVTSPTFVAFTRCIRELTLIMSFPALTPFRVHSDVNTGRRFCSPFALPGLAGIRLNLESRSGGARTLDLRFPKPARYQLRHTPKEGSTLVEPILDRDCFPEMVLYCSQCVLRFDCFFTEFGLSGKLPSDNLPQKS